MISRCPKYAIKKIPVDKTTFYSKHFHYKKKKQCHFQMTFVITNWMTRKKITINAEYNNNSNNITKHENTPNTVYLINCKS